MFGRNRPAICSVTVGLSQFTGTFKLHHRRSDVAFILNLLIFHVRIGHY
jgi:hypothetical protein